MNITDYTTLTGITVLSSNEAIVEANILRTRQILENMLGFPLDSTYTDNQYAESGISTEECPCPSTTITLDPADAVVTAYRLFPYNSKDKYLAIDPCTTINNVKLVKDKVTYRKYKTDEYRADYERGLIKYLELVECWCCPCLCNYVQLAVDAVWVWEPSSIPADLNSIWADMVTYYSDQKKDVISESMGPHSYRKGNIVPPQERTENLHIIKKYSGVLGIVRQIPTY